MRGRKLKLTNVIPMRGDGPAASDVDPRSAAVDRAVSLLRPKRLNDELRKEWDRVARLLANPGVDRLKPRYVDVILEYCRAIIRLRRLRATFETIADEVKEMSGRHGDQLKNHPQVGQINETWRQWRALVAMLGLSPADERNLIPGQGDLYDESDQFLA
jgi:P27 family predicted phage terminase small subunit